VSDGGRRDKPKEATMYRSMTWPAIVLVVGVLLALIAGAAVSLQSHQPAQAPARIEQPTGGAGGGHVNLR
jgi:multisubunit Na+/H+ antiporter MnhB subunit